MSYHEDIRIFLTSELGLPNSLKTDEGIFSSEMLDSIDALTIFVFLEKKYALKINPFDLGLDDFDSIDKIVDTVKRLSKQ